MTELKIKAHFKERNKITSLTSDPNIPEYAAFSLDVYRDPDRPPLPAGWQIFCDCPVEFQVDGYFGAAYYSYNEEYDWYNMVIAHRGTNNIDDLYEDVVYLSDKKDTPPQFYKGAVPFIQYVLQMITTSLPENSYVPDIHFTGHSLGATLAEISLPYVQTNIPDPISTTGAYATWGTATTFESPGSYEILQKMIARGEIAQEDFDFSQEITMTLNADVDAINSCMSHGSISVSSCSIPYSWVPLYDGTYPIEPTLLYFLYYFTVKDQHSMLKMYNFWNKNYPSAASTSIQQLQYNSDLTNWPSSPGRAYQYYISYGTEREGLATDHMMYWEGGNLKPGYIMRVWNSHPEIQPAYASYNDFHQDYLTVLLDNAKKYINKESSENLKSLSLHGLFKSSVINLRDRQKEIEKKLDNNGEISILERSTLKDLYKLDEQTLNISKRFK